MGMTGYCVTSAHATCHDPEGCDCPCHLIGDAIDAIQPARHDTDGQVFIAYFRADKILGFAWDGDIEHSVEVTREVGEPVIDRFEPPQIPRPQTHWEVFHAFQLWCDRYADNFEENR